MVSIQYRTLEDWNKIGYKVRKGETHSGRTLDGQALFADYQVSCSCTKCDRINQGYEDWEDYKDCSEFDLY